MCNCLFCLTSGGAQCCAIWSGMSVLFLVFAGLLLGSPPVYVKGMSAEHAKNASHNAYVVAGLYAATTLIAFFMYSYRSRQEKTKLGKVAKPTSVAENGLDDGDAFSVPLVNSSTSGGATSASAETRSGSSKKKKNAKSGKVEGSLTTI